MKIKNYTDALIDSLIESETEPKTYLEKINSKSKDGKFDKMRLFLPLNY